MLLFQEIARVGTAVHRRHPRGAQNVLRSFGRLDPTSGIIVAEHRGVSVENLARGVCDIHERLPASSLLAKDDDHDPYHDGDEDGDERHAHLPLLYSHF